MSQSLLGRSFEEVVVSSIRGYFLVLPPCLADGIHTRQFEQLSAEILSAMFQVRKPTTAKSHANHMVALAGLVHNIKKIKASGVILAKRSELVFGNAESKKFGTLSDVAVQDISQAVLEAIADIVLKDLSVLQSAYGEVIALGSLADILGGVADVEKVPDSTKKEVLAIVNSWSI